jgi:TATA-binding protein-associated factor
MPFILRRLKSEVLRELPEKIIQDYYCHMTEAQLELYREFHLDAKQQDLGRDNFESESNSAIALLTKMRGKF